ncbi:hypothetical protein [Brunnivagina elsteri]|uniref:Lysozyme inhibitor LprI N-terminal domain-containing protein n=1 Tax=Brunnivagina elsteri CCALA 953 TaxID=987040 RepID=A0A2A2THX7_9CYAN|nr:hypothetical protein [Calothrix elsteri]PAX53333.1 hypothetical protein CK510_14530 [Calothrix elsteri CCALA 953]
MKQISHQKIFPIVFFAIALSIVTQNVVSSLVVPNLDGESQPNRVKLSECMADVREVTSGWEQQQMNQAATAICDARKAHAKEKARFIGAISKLEKQYQGYTNHGFDKHVKVATQDAWNIVKNCIEFKEGFTHPHNVAIYQVPNEVRKSCYAIGTGLVESQLFTK